MKTPTAKFLSEETSNATKTYLLDLNGETYSHVFNLKEDTSCYIDSKGCPVKDAEVLAELENGFIADFESALNLF